MLKQTVYKEVRKTVEQGGRPVRVPRIAVPCIGSGPGQVCRPVLQLEGWVRGFLLKK